MNILNKLYLQLARYWTQASAVGRVVTIGAAVLMVATIVGTAVWSSTPDYKLLREGIAPAMAGEMVSILDTSGIPNRLNYSGTGIMVPASRWNQANVAISGISSGQDAMPQTSSSTLFPSKPGFGETLRQKEVSLEQSISSLRAIQVADVHLAMPEPSPFRKNRQPASASVIVEAHAGMALSQEVGSTIIHMVASAVEGLDPKDVTLSSSDGTLIGNVANNDPASVRRNYVRSIEVEKAIKAQDVLAASLGSHKSVVRVTAEVDDFLDRTITQNKILANDKVRIVEKIVSKDEKSPSSQSNGAAGTASNGGDGAGGATSKSNGLVSKKEETNETTYDYPRSTETTREVGGKLLKLSVSATVDVTVDSDDGSGTPVVTTVLTQEAVEQLIKTAVGFDAARGDQIHVVLAEIPESPLASAASTIPESQKWEFIGELARNASLGLAAVVALLIGMLTLKKITPIEVGTDSGDQRRSELLAELSSRVDQNPEAVSKILAAWLSQGEAANGETAVSKAA